MPAPPKGELFAVAGRFLIAPEALATGLTACALSVTYGDSSPKGRAKSTAGSFLIMPNTLATGFKSWLPLRGKTSPAPGEDVTTGDKRENLARERLRGRAPFPHAGFYATIPVTKIVWRNAHALLCCPHGGLHGPGLAADPSEMVRRTRRCRPLLCAVYLSAGEPGAH